jgi:peptidyl-prolyl cis-trans isomerase B (cyclophilin B)
MKKKLRQLLGLLLALCLTVGLCAACEKEDPDTLDPNLTYYADIVVQDYGTITVLLDPSAAPETVQNFVKLARSGFYDGLTFHRVKAGFVIQGGDPNGNGTGGSDTKIKGEFAANGYSNPISHTRGVISMARAKDYNSASCQFFIVHRDSTDSLDGLYAGFGHVIEGMEIVDEICAIARPINSVGLLSPTSQPVITTITIRTEPK